VITNKRCIFCLTTGRSGTKYLSNLLSLLPGINALHEPKPDFAKFAEMARNHPEKGRDFILGRKIHSINESMSNVYIETSHLFCKGFVEIFAHLGLEFDAIILRRNHRDVAKSLYRRNSIPGMPPMGTKYLLTPNTKGVFTKLPNWNKYHPYQLCYWYCLEIERRIQTYKFFKNIKTIVETDVHQLQYVDHFYRLCEQLDLPWLTHDGFETYMKKRGTRINKKDKETVNDISKLTDKQLDDWEEEIKCNIRR